MGTESRATMTATTKILLGVKDDGTMEAMLPPQKVPAKTTKKTKADGYRDMVIVLTILLGFFTVVSVTFAMFHHYQVNFPAPCSFHISAQEKPQWSFNIELDPEHDTRIVNVGNVTSLSSRSARLTAVKIVKEDSIICLIRHEEIKAKAKVAPGTKMPPPEEIEELMMLQKDDWHMQTERQVWGSQTDDSPIDLGEYPDWLQAFCPPITALSFRLRSLFVAGPEIDMESMEMPEEDHITAKDRLARLTTLSTFVNARSTATWHKVMRETLNLVMPSLNSWSLKLTVLTPTGIAAKLAIERILVALKSV